MTDAALAQHRTHKDAFLREHPDSPLPVEDRASFSGLPYYDEAPALRFTVAPDPVEIEDIMFGTTTGDERLYRRVATVSFTVNGDDQTLALYTGGGSGFFLPFRDATSGGETYGAGRYLDLHPNDDGTVTVDFNYAYAPFCAYSDTYSCALPPVENWMDVPIRAGERTV